MEIKRGRAMTLYEYLSLVEQGDEITVWDKEYDVEMYFDGGMGEDDEWDKSISELSKLLTIVTIHPTGVTVNYSEVIEKHLEDLDKADLFHKCDIDSIMYGINAIMSGYVSEDWMEKFVDTLKTGMKRNVYMNELVKCIENGTLFSYSLSDGGTGIVIADSPEEAEQKVRAAYEKHGGYENGNMDGINVNIWELYQKPFDDAQDVLEIFS